jgi:predicted 3-demethylubiquinone-9 3-methyltransferase (glyoxalase superfamily)
MTMNKISPCLWFEKEAEEAANYYVSLLPDSKIVHVQKSAMDYPGGKEGSVLVVYFELAGQSFLALNAGTTLEYNNCVSFSIDCKDQAEVDRLWSKILKDGGQEVQCSWIRDKFNVPWQIVPSDLPRMMADPDKEKAARVMAAMMNMVKIDVAALHKAYAGD